MGDNNPTCRLCGGRFSERGLTRHLQSCLGESRGIQRLGYHLKITSAQDDHSMLQVLLGRFSTLTMLDRFLRDIWLECCGHESAFDVGGIRYEAGAGETPYYGWGKPPRPLDTKVERVFEHGLRFGHVYDFGATTELDLTCYGLRPWPSDFALDSPESTQRVVVLARNEAPLVECDICGEEAILVCNGCKSRGRPMCQGHAEEHDCQTGLLPVVNSPRMGVCGYTGRDWPNERMTQRR